jgi:nitrite reductase/ring-hydroxylating ferredoxin subunit
LVILISGSVLSCRDRNTGRVPDVPVNISINVLLPEFFDLSVTTGSVYLTGGSRGIIVYRKSDTEFIAIERHSTHLPENECAVIVKDDGLIIEDPCSGSQWIITDGTLVQGPASLPLITYDTNYSPPILFITN